LPVCMILLVCMILPVCVISMHILCLYFMYKFLKLPHFRPSRRAAFEMPKIFRSLSRFSLAILHCLIDLQSHAAFACFLVLARAF
jgi:hypothetical protein